MSDNPTPAMLDAMEAEALKSNPIMVAALDALETAAVENLVNAEVTEEIKCTKLILALQSARAFKLALHTFIDNAFMEQKADELRQKG